MKYTLTRPINPTKKPVVESLPKTVTIAEWAETHSQKHKQKLLFANDEPANFVPSRNGLFDSIRLAYCYHLNLNINPQIIWLNILQGLSKHVEANSEKLRSKFVTFEGKKNLDIQVESIENSKEQYQYVFKQLNHLIAKEINPDTLKLIHPDFTDTPPLYSTIFNITTMDCLKSFFTYSMSSECGIRNVKMSGTEEDWIKLIIRTEELLAKFDFNWWSPYIIPILQEFLNTYKGQVNVKFWDCCYKAIPTFGSGYCPEIFTGWIMNLFPYQVKKPNLKSESLKTLESLYDFHDKIGNQDDQKSEDIFMSPQIKPPSENEKEDVPFGYSSTPFNIDDNGYIKETMIDAGSFGVDIDYDTFEVEPIVSWAIRLVDKKL